MEKISSKILAVALSFVGYEEIKGNQGFKNSEFEELMMSYGFVKPKPWCATFVKAVYGEAGINHQFMTAGVVNTMRRYISLSSDNKLHSKPVEGCLAIYRRFENGVPQIQGHVGIVEKIGKADFMLIEGNSNDRGYREGKKVAYNKKVYNWNTDNGLRLLGFLIVDELISENVNQTEED